MTAEVQRSQPGPRFPNLLRQLWFHVLVAMTAGVVLGLYQPALGEQMKPFGDAFVKLIGMIVGPIVFCSVVHGIAGMSDMKRAGRVALKALIYFEVITTTALVIALFAVNLLKPGEGMHIDASAIDASAITSYEAQAHEQTVSGFLLSIIPTTFVDAFVKSNILQIVLIAVLFAFALILVGQRAHGVLEYIDGLSQILFKIVSYIMWAAPIGAFGAIAFTVGRFGAESLQSLGLLILEFYLLCFVFVFGVLGAVAYRVGVSLFKLLHYVREELLIVAATTSTETVLPRVMQKMRALGCDESVVGLVVPTGYSFNLDGTCLYLAFVAVFLAQVTGTPLDIGQQVTLLLVLLLVSKGAAGVAGAALIVLTATLSSVGTIPVSSMALVVGIHRLLAEALTFVNLVGNCLATIVVAKWERAIDDETLRARVGLS